MKGEFDAIEAISEYKRTGNINLRNDIVLRYLELVRLIAVSLRNIYSKYATIENAKQIEYLALPSVYFYFDKNACSFLHTLVV